MRATCQECWSAQRGRATGVEAACTRKFRRVSAYRGLVTYSATAFRLLFSAPSDIPSDDLQTAVEAVLRWNAMYGRQFGAVVVPTSWHKHSVARHGAHPQVELNEQLVDDADIVVALFWCRLGSPTETAASGTVEEIEKANDAGAYVGVLRCARPIPTDADLDQLGRLRSFYEDIRARSLYLSYADDRDLADHVDAILTRAVSMMRGRAEARVETTQSGAAIWPRIERSERTDFDARGRPTTRTEYHLILSNTGVEPARRVRHVLEAEEEGSEPPMEVDPSSELEVLAPGGEAPYNLFVSMGSAGQVRCKVQWADSRGEQENFATLRLF
jgi:hypothetical protein